MKVRVSGIPGIANVELAGDITGLRESEGYLVLSVSTSVPVGCSVKAALTHQDLMRAIRLLLRPANLRYLVFGFSKPAGSKPISQ